MDDDTYPLPLEDHLAYINGESIYSKKPKIFFSNNSFFLFVKNQSNKEFEMIKMSVEDLICLKQFLNNLDILDI